MGGATRHGWRWVGAVSFCVVLLLGLAWVLRAQGLGGAANVAQLVSLAPLVAAVLVWARRRHTTGNDGGTTKTRSDLSGSVPGFTEPGESVNGLRIPQSSRAKHIPKALRKARIRTFVERPAIGARLVTALEKAAFQPGAPIVLTGAGGFGKTTLAAWACRQVQHLFPDGVLWVDLGQRPDERRLGGILTDQVTLLTGARQEYDTVSGAADALAAALDDRRVLLVIDDAWREQDVELFLRGGSRCVRLVTTRRPPVIPGLEMPVGSMTRDEAATMLLSGLPGSSAEDLHSLLERCGHWPLALALVAGTLHSLRRRMPVTRAVDLLLVEFDRAGVGVLDELADADGVKGIATTLAVSLDELAAASPHRRMSLIRYAQLAAFPEGLPIPHPLVERLWQVSTAQAQSEYDRLLNRSLIVQADESGVRLHPVIRDQLRHRFSDQVGDAGRTLIDRCRPAEGWHTLPSGHELWAQLVYHLLQVSPVESTELLRDFRFLVARLSHGGPLALESDLQEYLIVYPDESYAGSLLTVLRQEAHLFSGHEVMSDLALTLYSRLFGRNDVSTEITNLEEALPIRRLVAARALPDQPSPCLVRVFPGHRRAGCSLAWSPDDGMLVSADHDGALRQWDPSTGEQQVVIPLFDDPIVRTRLSPDCRHLAVVCPTTTTAAKAGVKAVDTSGTEIKDLQITRTWVRIVDVGTGTTVAERPVAVSSIHDQDPPDVAWAPDSATIAFTDYDRVRLWRPFDHGECDTLTTGAEVGEKAVAVAWHPTAGLACLVDRRVARRAGCRLIWWTEPTGDRREQAWMLTRLHSRMFRDRPLLAWSPDGRQLAVGGNRGRLLITEPSRRRLVTEIETALDLTGLSWRPDGRALACTWSGGNGGLVTLWREQPTDPLNTQIVIDSAGVKFFDVVWYRSGEHIAVATSMPRIRVYRPAVATSNDSDKLTMLTSVRWQPLGRLLAVTDLRTTHIVDAETTGSADWHIDGHFGPVAWSPDGRYLTNNATGEGPIQLREARTGRVIREFSTETGFGRHLVYSWLTSQRLLTRLTFYEEIGIINADTGAAEKTRFGLLPDILLVNASQDGSWLAVSFEPRGLDILEVDTGRQITLDKDARYLSTCFVPGHLNLVAVVEDRELELWDIVSRKVIARRDYRETRSVVVDPTGRYVAAVASSGRIGLFDARTLDPICQLVVNGTTHDCEFDSSGERLAVVGSAGLYLLRVEDHAR